MISPASCPDIHLLIRKSKMPFCTEPSVGWRPTVTFVRTGMSMSRALPAEFTRLPNKGMSICGSGRKYWEK